MADLAIEAKQFLRSTLRGILSTHSAKFSGYPFGSVAPFVVDHHGRLIILISTLAEHTKNILQNPKVSMVVLKDEADLQANARLTLLGEASQADKADALLRARYLRYHPQAETYFDMHDFYFYQINVTHARYIAGFGKMGWLDSDALNASPDAIALTAQESDIIEHMNADHADSLRTYCAHFHQLSGDRAQMVGIDPLGFDVRLHQAEQSQMVRFDFDSPVVDANSARQALVAMSKLAKS